MNKDFPDALEAGLNQFDKHHRRRILQEALRIEIFDERIDSFVKEAATKLFKLRDYNEIIYIPQVTIEKGRGTITYGRLDEPYVRKGRHTFERDLDDSPFKWEHNTGLSTTPSTPQYEKAEDPRGNRASKEWLFLKDIIDEVFPDTDGIASIFIMNLQFDEMLVVPAYKRSIFEGRLFFTAGFHNPHEEESVVDDIQEEYEILQEEVEEEEVEEAFENNEIDFIER